MSQGRLNTDATRVVERLARLGLSAVFVGAALPKLANPGDFATAIDNYQMLPEGVPGLLAVALPVAELVAAAALWVPGYARGAAMLSALMLAVFAGAMAQAKLRGIDLQCGCFGASVESQVSWWKIAGNAAGAALAGWLCGRDAARGARPGERAFAGDPG